MLQKAESGGGGRGKRRQWPRNSAAVAAERAAADPGKDPEVAERITVSSELVRNDHSLSFFCSIEKILKKSL